MSHGRIRNFQIIPIQRQIIHIDVVVVDVVLVAVDQLNDHILGHDLLLELYCAQCLAGHGVDPKNGEAVELRYFYCVFDVYLLLQVDFESLNCLVRLVHHFLFYWKFKRFEVGDL